MSLVIRSVAFNGDGSVVLEWLDTDKDVKINGLVLNHVALLPPEDYEDEIDAIRDAANAAVESALIDATKLESAIMQRPDDDEDER